MMTMKSEGSNDINSSLSGDDSILGLGAEDEEIHSQTRTHSVNTPARRNNESATNYSWRPPTPPPSLDGTRDNSTHGRTASDFSTKNDPKSWLPSLFHKKNDMNVLDGQQTIMNSPDSASSMLGNHSLLLKEESEALSVNQGSPSTTALNFIKPKKRRVRAASRIKRTINTLLSQDHNSAREKMLVDENDASYQMMKSQHGKNSSSRTIPQTLESADVSFFYSGMDELEAQRQLRNKSQNVNHQGYFDHQTRRKFIEAHALLNADIGTYHDDDASEDADEMDYDFMTLFTFGCSPSARARMNEQKKALPAIADITNSNQSYMVNGRIQMRLPTDNVRLVMDEFLEPGILSVERDFGLEDENDDIAEPFLGSNHSDNESTFQHNSTHDQNYQDENYCPNLGASKPIQRSLMDEIDLESNAEFDGQWEDPISRENGLTKHQTGPKLQKSNSKLPPLRYLLTVDQNLYKQIIKEVPDSRMPCGLYFCCHDSVDGSRHVNIGVAIMILTVVFLLLFVGTCIWPTE